MTDISAALDALLAETDPDELARIIDALPASVAASLLSDGTLTPGTKTERGLIDMARHLLPGFKARPHILHLAERIESAVEKVEAGESQYLIVEMPPRAGKSTITTQIAPAWLLHKHPSWEYAITSHSSQLANSWSRQIRRWATAGSLGPSVAIAPDSGAVGRWETIEGGIVHSMSTGESFTGRGAKVLIVDDPHKDFADAHSANKRDGVWDWWKSVAYNRLQPPVLVIVIQTRWHEDDLVGRLLSPATDGDPDVWERIRLPAIADHTSGLDELGRHPGDPLISPLLDEGESQATQRWKETKRAVGTYIWSAMYQQAPAPPDGRMIQREWIQHYEAAPARFDEVIQSWDLAFSESESSSYVVGQIWGRNGSQKYLLDQFRDRTDIIGTLEAIESMSAKWPEARLKLIERKANGPAVLALLKRKISGLRPIDPAGSKIERLHAAIPSIEAGDVFLPSPALAPWIHDYVEELVAFPSGAHDDQVDATTQALTRLDTPRKRPRAKVKAY